LGEGEGGLRSGPKPRAFKTVHCVCAGKKKSTGGGEVGGGSLRGQGKAKKKGSVKSAYLVVSGVWRGGGKNETPDQQVPERQR